MSNNEEDNHSNAGFWLGLVLGGVIGGLMSYLATDDKSKLRKELIKKGKIVLDHLEDFKDGAIEKKEEVKEEMAGKINKARAEIKEKVEEIPEVAQEAVESVQKAADKAIAEIVETADKVENNAHKKARLFFLKKGKPLVKK